MRPTSLRSRRFLLPAGAAVLGTAIALLVAEVALRIAGVASDGVVTVTEADFQRIPGLFSPGQHVLVRQVPALPHTVRINDLGYRGADFSIEKMPNELRVVAIGDSYTYGDLVDDGETLPAVLERELARQCGRPVTVINAGVGGSTILTAIAMLERALVAAPDVVLLTFSENDVFDMRTDEWLELAENRRAKSRFPLAVVYPAVRELALWNFALKLRARWRSRFEQRATAQQGAVNSAARPSPQLAADTLAQKVDAADVERLRAAYAERFQELVIKSRAGGRPLVFVAAPSHWTFGGVSDEQLQWVTRMASEQGVETLNLLGEFRETRLSELELYLLPHDGHPAPRAYEIAGAWLATQMNERGLCGGRGH